MKTTTMIKSYFQRFMLAVVAALVSVAAMAQDGDKKVDISVNTNKDNFWGSPWVWVIGGAVFVLLLAAILRGGGSKSDA